MEGRKYGRIEIANDAKSAGKNFFLISIFFKLFSALLKYVVIDKIEKLVATALMCEKLPCSEDSKNK